MKKRYLGLLAMSTVLTLGLVAVNEHNSTVDAESEYYVKVTENLSDWTGNYLIVYEAESVAFNGALTAIDSANNNVAVTISDNKIEATDVVKASSFTITEGYNIRSASGYNIGAKSDTNCLLNNQTKTYINTLSLNSDYSINIIGEGGAYLRYNSNSDQKRFRYYKTSSYLGQKAIQLYKLAESSTQPDVPQQPEDKTSEVKALFTKYYNGGTYTKESVLNVNETAVSEVAKYFHANQTVRYRKTEYTPEGLSMTTKSNEDSDYGSETSVYTTVGNTVVHTGLGGNYTVQNQTVENWFVTLDDFMNSDLTGWTKEGEVYTYTLPETTCTDGEVKEHDMTRMAREFVAPMWLAPNKDNFAYSIYSKLTVQEVGSTLVMKLYPSSGNSGILTDDADGVFSQVKISYPRTAITSISNALNAEEGAEVELTGEVVSIYQAYNSTYNNISVYIADELGVQILSYRLTGNVEVHDVITITGVIADYYGTRQIGEDATFEKIGTAECKEFNEKTCTKPATCKLCDKEKDDVLADHNFAEGSCTACGAPDPDYEGPVVEKKEYEFTLGANGSASHNDGSGATTYSETVGGYTLSITNGTKMYTGAIDAKGNSCLKFGTSSAVGSMKFTVPSDVKQVVIYVAKYKSNTTKISVNNVQYTLTKNSNSGEYDEIIVDTSSNKTVTFTTVSGGVRCMINSIVFVA